MKGCLTLALCALLAASTPSCARRAPPPEQCSSADAGTPVDPTLLAFLSRARAAHHLADAHENSGELEAATVPLLNLVSGPFPAENGAELPPEVREVLADTHARLADLFSRQGAFDRAVAEAHAGLEQASEPNYFRGHLLETEGLVEERHAKAEATRDPKAAAVLRARAIGLLEQAMAVQSKVIEGGPSGSGKVVNPPAPAPSAPAH